MEFGLAELDDSARNKLQFLSINSINNIEYHRGLDEFNPESPDDYMLYTGRGPSHGSFHIGHLPGLYIIKEFQKFLNSKIFFMISDDEKIFRDNINISEMNENTQNTIQQLNTLGLTNDNTIYHINSNGISHTHYNILIKLMSFVNINTLNNIFGIKTNIGEYFYPLYQILPCFLGKQAIIIAGKDQDPFFRLARDIARRIGHKPPIIIYTRSIPGLDGSDKMSTSVPSSLPIFLTDDMQTISQKISKVKKVGAGSLDELFTYGSNLKEDTLYQLITIFETNNENLQLIRTGYTTGFLSNVDMEYLQSLFGKKGIITKNNKTMITTYGVRTYLINLIHSILKT